MAVWLGFQRIGQPCVVGEMMAIVLVKAVSLLTITQSALRTVTTGRLTSAYPTLLESFKLLYQQGDGRAERIVAG
jgi:hypothetical protein